MSAEKLTEGYNDENIVYIGRKPVMDYVLATLTQFNKRGFNEVILKARGRAISKAVDVSEIVRNKFISEVTVDEIKIGTEEVKREDGSTVNVSFIEMYLKRLGERELYLRRIGRIETSYSQRINENPTASVKILTEVLTSPEIEDINLKNIGSDLKDKEISKLFSAFDGLIKGKKVFENLKKAESSLKNLKKVKNSQYLYELLDLIDQIRSFSGMDEIGYSEKLIAEVRNHIRNIYPDLVPVLDEMTKISDIVSKYTKVSELGDQLYYINEGISLCEEAQRYISEKLYEPYSDLLRETVIQWRNIFSETLEDIRGTAKLNFTLKSRNVAFSEVTIALLSVKNEGVTSASNVRVKILPSLDYSAIDEIKSIEIISPKEEVPFEFRIEPLQKEKIRVEFQIQYDDPRNKDCTEKFADVIEFFEIEEVFKKIDNPYIAGHPVRTQGMFFGREDIFKFVLENLRGKYQNNTIILHGQRRTGKTSILYQLMTGRLPSRYIPVFLDFQHLPDVNTSQFFFNVQKAIFKRLSKRRIDIEVFKVDDFEKYPYIKFDEFLENCREILDGKLNLVLLFDEFEELENKVEKGLISDDIFGYFRSLIQHQDWIIIVFSGTHKLAEMTKKYWSVFFNIALHKKISFLKENEANDLITQPVAGKLEYDDLAIEKIMRATANHPYFIQLLCHSLVDYLNEIEKRNYVTITDVNRALEDVIEKGTAHFSHVWDGSTTNEKILLSIMALIIDEGKPRAVMEEVQRIIKNRKIKLKKKEIRAALKNLCERDILQSKKATPGYSFKVDLIQMWITENKPLNKLIEEELS